MRSAYRPRWPLLLTLIAGIGGIIALTYVTTRPSGEALPAHGGRYVEGVAGTPSRLNPLFTSNEVEEDLVALIFSGLVRLGPKGEIQPDLAQDWSVGPDGREYTFRLRERAFWHDGEPLDASDVLFTVRAIQHPGFRGDPRLADVFADVRVTAPDRSTVIFTLPKPFAPFLAFAAVGILPEHRLGALDVPRLAEAPFNRHPIGSGPFRLVELRPDGAELRSFDAYHLGRPLLETLELRFYREDATLLNALLDDEIDGALLRQGLSPQDLALLDDKARWVQRSLHTTTYSLIYLNLNIPALQVEAVRRALQHGLDREALIEETLAGQALPVDSPISRDLWAYVGSPDAYRYDPGRAAALLDEAGWTSDNGVRSKDGTPLRLTLATVDDPVQTRVAQAVARQWGQLGVQVDVQASGASQFSEEMLLGREFDAALSTLRPPGSDPDPYPFWHSTQAFGEGRNLSGFSHPEADRLLEDARQTPSPEQRAEEYRAFQEIFARELPAVLLYTPTYRYVYRPDVQGVSPGVLLTLSSRFYDVHRWFIETEPQTDDGA